MDFEIEDETAENMINDDRRSGVFAITNLVTGKMYIGKAFDLRGRWSIYFSSLRKGTFCNKEMQADFDDFGAELFEIEVIEYCNTETLEEMKQYYIDFYTSIGKKLYNWDIRKTSQLNIGKPRSEETRKKISKFRRGRYHTLETKVKIGSVKKGKPRSEETRQKLSAANKGKMLSGETKKKMSAAKKEFWSKEK